jgi:hypothetical protein
LRARRLCNITRSNSDNVLLVDLLSLGRRLRLGGPFSLQSKELDPLKVFWILVGGCLFKNGQKADYGLG